uniref:Uncharacterized protein n=1 Tax=Arundo donax TaxID=35708 RepID=A0A0A8YJB0_ARUDO
MFFITIVLQVSTLVDLCRCLLHLKGSHSGRLLYFIEIH